MKLKQASGRLLLVFKSTEDVSRALPLILWLHGVIDKKVSIVVNGTRVTITGEDDEP